jgi:hypothetical protein
VREEPVCAPVADQGIDRFTKARRGDRGRGGGLVAFDVDGDEAGQEDGVAGRDLDLGRHRTLAHRDARLAERRDEQPSVAKRKPGVLLLNLVFGNANVPAAADHHGPVPRAERQVNRIEIAQNEEASHAGSIVSAAERTVQHASQVRPQGATPAQAATASALSARLNAIVYSEGLHRTAGVREPSLEMHTKTNV